MIRLQAWLNSNPTHVNHLTELINYWSNVLHGAWHTSMDHKIVHADLNNDSIEEILITMETAKLIRIDQQSSKYNVQEFRWDNDLSGGNHTIWGVQDINNDGIVEIITENKYCGAHTCFTELTILQWTDSEIRNIFDQFQEFEGLSVPHSYMDWEIDTSNIPSFTLTGGTSGSAGAGWQRPNKAIYVWNGTDYELQSIEPIPTEPQAFWAVQDGARFIRIGDFAKAQENYSKALTYIYGQPMDSGATQIEPKTYAAARTQLIWLAINAGNMQTAEYWYQESQANDGEFAILSKTLWETYQQTNDLHEACKPTYKIAGTFRYPFINYLQHANLSSVVCVEPEK